MDYEINDDFREISGNISIWSGIIFCEILLSVKSPRGAPKNHMLGSAHTDSPAMFDKKKCVQLLGF